MSDGQADGAAGTQAAAPAATPGAPRWVRRVTVVAAVLAVGVVAATWLLGGFELRRDHLHAAPGDEVDAGNLVFALDDATAQQDTTGEWVVTVRGTVRNDHDEALAPRTGDSGNLAVSRGVGTTAAVLTEVELGGTWRRNLVPPGEPPVALAAMFTFPDGTTFADTIRVGVFAMEKGDRSILGIGGGLEDWHEADDARPTTVVVPLTVLPPRE